MKANQLFVATMVAFSCLFATQGSAKKPQPVPQVQQLAITDSTGKIIGPMISWGGRSTAAVGFDGNGHQYWLTVNNADGSFDGTAVFFDDQFCSGNAFISSGASDALLPVGGIGTNTAYAPDTSNPPVSRQLRSKLLAFTSTPTCTPVEVDQSVWPAVPDVDLSQYLPPFSLSLIP
jgi:hypothetical protein